MKLSDSISYLGQDELKRLAKMRSISVFKICVNHKNINSVIDSIKSSFSECGNYVETFFGGEKASFHIMELARG